MPTPFFADLVRELCQEGGTGPLTPAGAVPGHRCFADAVPGGHSFHYAIAGIAWPGQWEAGLGRIDSSGRLVRELVSTSSSGGAPVDFARGLKTLALTVGADWFAARAESEAALQLDLATLAGALADKQPLSTSHAAAATGAASDVVTVRRGAGWINVPLSTIPFRDADGRHALSGALSAPGGTAAVPAIAFSGDPGTGLFRAAADSVGVATGGIERVRIAPTGRMGIGTSNPEARLDISGAVPNIRVTPVDYSAAYGLEIATGGQIEAQFKARGNTGELVVASGRSVGWGGYIALVTDTVEKWRIMSGGTFRPASDNAYDIGAGSSRVKVIFAGTGTINTSDAREKSWRGPATAAELSAAKRIAAELGFYQWNDAITEKGVDKARYHFGVRAQSIWAIMADEGLVEPLEGGGASARYAFLCHDEWPDDASGTRSTRLGIRPDQLALFLIASHEQRLAALESTR